jgi:hypothetical protein
MTVTLTDEQAAEQRSDPAGDRVLRPPRQAGTFVVSSTSSTVPTDDH